MALNLKIRYRGYELETEDHDLWLAFQAILHDLDREQRTVVALQEAIDLISKLYADQ